MMTQRENTDALLETLEQLRVALTDVRLQHEEVVRNIKWGDADSIWQAILTLDVTRRYLEEVHQRMREIGGEVYLLTVTIRDALEAIKRERNGIPDEIHPMRVPVIS